MSSFFQELKSRKVFRVAAVYAVVAWLLIQVADTLSPALQLPDWTVSFVTVLFILGFFPTLIAAWAYEISPEGSRTESVTAATPQSLAAQSAAPNQTLLIATFVLVLLVAGFQIADRFLFQSSVFGLAGSSSTDEGPRSGVLRSEINLQIPWTRDTNSGAVVLFDLSSDGRQLIYTDSTDALPWKLYSRNMASGDIDILSGESDDAYVISPSGTRLLTNTRVALRIHADSGGILQSIPANIGFGMSKWLSDDEVLFTDGDRSIHRMSLSSENDTRLTAPEGLDEWHIDPQALPGGNAIVYTSGNYVASNMGTEGSEIRLHKLDSDSSQTLIRDGYMARYAHSGHIVFIRAGDLWAVPFDSESMQVVGEEVSVIEGIESYPANGFANYAFSETGRLVYLPGDEYQRIEPGYTWLSRQGANEEIPLPTGYYVDPELSPDNELLAITRNEEDGSSDIWVYDLTRETFGRRTFSGTARNPKWSPDGSRLAYSQTGQGIWLINADGTGQPQQLTSEPDARPSSFITASGELLYLINSGANVTLKTLSYRDDSWIASPVFPADYPYFNAEVSPDGNWIAYVSRESGDFHVYVRPYPDVENGKWLISNVRGVEPLWNRNGSELFYRESNTLMSVEFETENGFIPGTPKALLPDCCIITSNPPSYAVSGDGERFLTFKLNSSADIGRSDEEVRLTVVENWFEELDRLAPPDPQ